MKIYLAYDHDYNNKSLLNIYPTDPKNNRIEIDDLHFVIEHVFDLIKSDYRVELHKN